MKRLLVLVPLLALGCGSSKPKIVGSWESGSLDGATYFTFQDDKTFTMVSPHGGGLTGTYTLDGDHIVLTAKSVPDKPAEAVIKWESDGAFSLTSPQFGTTPIHFSRVSASQSKEATDKQIATIQQRTEKTVCLTNLKQVAVASMIYLSDNDDTLPNGVWSDQLMPYSKNLSIFTCPTLKKEGKTGGYAINSEIQGKKMKTILDPSTTVLFLETNKPGMGIAANKSELPSPPRHDGSNVIAFADAHVKLVKP